MQRRPEPELMDTVEQARAYAEADFSEPNALFLRLLAEQAGRPGGRRALDLGCGPADIVIRLLRRYIRAALRRAGRQPADARPGARPPSTRCPASRPRARLLCDKLPSRGWRPAPTT
jgi:hypothetical protein